VDPSRVGSFRNASGLFNLRVVQKINADYLFSKYYPVNGAAPAFSTGFGADSANEFRIVTIANAVASGVPAYAVRASEFHDHYCPGVTSGIMMAQVMKEYFAKMGGAKAWFVHGLQPWCKEDALMVMLNATPGKSGYAATYSTAADWAGWALGSRTVDIVNKKVVYPASIIYGQKGRQYVGGAGPGLLVQPRSLQS
jgi:hypothetical protein